MEIYMDNFTVYGDTFQEALDNLEKVLVRCQETNLSLSHEKCHILRTKGIVLGHHISPTRIQVDPAKIKFIRDLPMPTTQKDVCNFLGHAGYYRRFIENFTKIASPLFQLLTKATEFSWNEQCQTTFETMKEKLSIAPILRGPNWSIPFHISTDALDTTIGVVLGQKEEQRQYAIYYISKNLTPAEKNYTVTEKDFLDVIYAINKFRHYIAGYSVFVHIDHSAIRYLMNKLITNGRVTRWFLLLQEFGIAIIDKPGRENVIADFLSRLTNEGEAIPVEDAFLDEHLFALSTNTPWFADITNYLVVGKLPQHLSPKERQRVIQQSATYSWI
jgi:hypothetical protein